MLIQFNIPGTILDEAEEIPAPMQSTNPPSPLLTMSPMAPPTVFPKPKPTIVLTDPPLPSPMKPLMILPPTQSPDNVAALVLAYGGSNDGCSHRIPNRFADCFSNKLVYYSVFKQGRTLVEHQP